VARILGAGEKGQALLFGGEYSLITEILEILNGVSRK
jgi:hypothetical protein